MLSRGTFFLANIRLTLAPPVEFLPQHEQGTCIWLTARHYFYPIICCGHQFNYHCLLFTGLTPALIHKGRENDG